MSFQIVAPLPPEYAAAAQNLINDISTGLRLAIWEQINSHRRQQYRPPVEQVLLQALEQQAHHMLLRTEATLAAGSSSPAFDELNLDHPFPN